MVKNSMLGEQNENTLFSSSMSELFSRKLRISSNNALFGHSADTYREEEEPFQSLEEIEARTIGNLLPKDDDLFGMVDGHDLEESDFFGSIGGMDLDDDDSSYHRIRKTPYVTDQKFTRVHDVRATEAALQAPNRSSIAGKQFTFEPSHPGGTRGLVQLPSGFDQDEFAQFMKQSNLKYDAAAGFTGSLPRLVSTPGSNSGNFGGMNSAARATMNPLLERLSRGFQSHPSVDSFDNQFKLAESNQSQGRLFDIQGTSNTSSFHARSLPEYNDDLYAGSMIGNINPRQETIDNRHQIHGINSGHADLSVDVSYRHPVTWGNPYHNQPPAVMWQNSPSASPVNKIGSPHPPQILHGVQRAPTNTLNPALTVYNHHVGSAPARNSQWDMRKTCLGESPDAASAVHRGSLGSMIISNKTLQSVDFSSHNISPPVSGNCLESSGIQAQQQKSLMFTGRSQILPVMNSSDPSDGRDSSSRNENFFSQTAKKQFELDRKQIMRAEDSPKTLMQKNIPNRGNSAKSKKHYELDLERIMRGEDLRTTLMIKNIPNKYTAKMLLSAMGERQKGTFDFIYLPIDFKNKCNVGYAFINMTDPEHIIPLYETFNGKKWGKFHSEKVASIAYGRIQGKDALIAHFQNSSLLNEDKRCRPILFKTEGPNAGEQVPFPAGASSKVRRAKPHANTNEGQQENPTIVAKEENQKTVKENSSSASVKQSD